MTTRYTEKQIEDVALILRLRHDFYQSYEARLASESTAKAFANLFAADNPKCCTHCGYIEGATEICDSANGQLHDEHTFEYGFDREQFLAACGLKKEG